MSYATRLIVDLAAICKCKASLKAAAKSQKTAQKTKKQKGGYAKKT